MPRPPATLADLLPGHAAPVRGLRTAALVQADRPDARAHSEAIDRLVRPPPAWPPSP